MTSLPAPGRPAVRTLVLLSLVSFVATATPGAAQQSRPTQGRPLQGAQPQRQAVKVNQARAESLYVSADPADHPQRDFARDMANKARTDSIYTARSRGVMEFTKIRYRSRAGDMDVPAYLFAPLDKRGARGHAAMVWVHGGVHGDWGATMFPFVKEAIERGYVIVAPDYRGSTGHGAAHYNAIDYGGKEVDDVMGAYDYLKTLPYVDSDRVGVMGWSHGGFIASHLVMRDETPFKAAAAIVPVTNLVFRLGYKGPGYQRSFSTQALIRGLPHEKRDEYIRRSPLYQVEKLNVPILVHVATNDTDVDYVEDQQMVWKLRALKPDLAETKVYVDPAPWGNSGGHAFSRRVDPNTLERVDSPAQIDSWNRTWVFFEWILRPYEDKSKPPVNKEP
jgi:dipeptidyl aminopeptidase/acylaminoacyl peptidase